MAFLLYAATAAALLALTTRFVRPMSWIAAAVLFALPLVLVGRALITDSVYGPIDYLYQDAPYRAANATYAAHPPRNASATDVFSQFFPWRRAVQASLQRGQWPLWNAYNLCGHPLSGEVQAAPYSPFTLLAVLLPAAVSMTYTFAMVLLLAALGAFILARELECSEGASLFAAIGWGLAPCIVLYGQTAMGFATAYMPLLLAASRRVVRNPTIASGGLLMIALALCVLAGHPESLFLNVIVGCAYAAFELVRNRIHPLRPMVVAIGAGIVAAGVCAIFLLPLLEALPQSAEVLTKSGQSAHAQGVHGTRALAALARDFFPYLHVRSWTWPNFGLIGAETAAAGSLVLALAVYAIWRKRSAETWFFAVLAIVCIAAGIRWAPVANTLQKIPLLHITHHDRLAFAGALCLIVLAAFAVDELVRRDDRRFAAITFAGMFVFLALGTLWLTHHVLLSEVAGGYGRHKIFAELFFLIVAVFAVLHTPARWLVPALLALLAGQRWMSEVDTFSTYPARAAWPKLTMLEPLQQIREPFRIVGVGSAFPPASNTFYGLEDVRGYEALTLFQFVQTWKLWNRPYGSWFQQVDDLSAPILSFMNVRFAIQDSALPVPSGWRPIGGMDGAALLENDHVIDRLFLPKRVSLGAISTAEIVDRMGELRDFRELAWIGAAGETVERQNGPGTLHLRTRSVGGEYDFDADMQGDGWVVISDSAWRGWRAYVDGRRVKLSRANAAFLSVYLPPGKHSVRVVFLPASFVRGRAITVATLALIAITAAVRRVRRRGSAPYSSASSY